MITALGKVLRIMRLERNLLLKDMADSLSVKPSYLSSIENGKKKPSEKLVKLIIDIFQLTGLEAQKMWDAYWKTIEEISLHISSEKPFQIDLGLALARSFEKLTEDQAVAIEKILRKGE